MTICRPERDDMRLKPYAGLTDAQLKACATSASGVRGGMFPQFPEGLFIAESKNVILRALEAGCEPVSLFMEERWLDHETPLVRRVEALDPNIPTLVMNREDFQELTGYQVTRGALAAFRRPVLPSVQEICQNATRIAVLEDVTNYTNIGAIFRSAAALGIDGILITPNCHDPLYRRASRVSMGTVFQVPWTRIAATGDWASEGVALLHNLGFSAAALALSDDAVSLADPRLAAEERLALVLGTEGDGLRASTIATCDYIVKIPMQHAVDSLNVAAASAVAFWELAGKRFA